MTPRELLAFETSTVKAGGGSLWDMMRNTTMHFNGEEWPLHSEEDLRAREQYPLMGKLMTNFYSLYTTLSGTENGLALLSNYEKQLTAHIENNKMYSDSLVVKWFDGNLQNDELFPDLDNEPSFISAVIFQATFDRGNYKGYAISTCFDKGIIRINEHDEEEICEGYFCNVYPADDYNYDYEIDSFTLAVGYELHDLSDLAVDKAIKEHLEDWEEYKGIEPFINTEDKDLSERILNFMFDSIYHEIPGYFREIGIDISNREAAEKDVRSYLENGKAMDIYQAIDDVLNEWDDYLRSDISVEGNKLLIFLSEYDKEHINSPITINVDGEDMLISEIENIVLAYVKEAINLADMSDDISIKGIKVYGSRTRDDYTSSSDLDVLIEYEGDFKENMLFNLLHDDEEPLFIGDIPVDINPIREEESGTIEEYLDSVKDFRKREPQIIKKESLTDKIKSASDRRMDPKINNRDFVKQL